MASEKFAAGVRVKRGARWLDENFPGWEERIDIDTLELNNGNNCICGQVFEEPASEEGLGGYEYAVDNLFSEANSWITSLIKKQPIEARTLHAYDRAEQVSIVGENIRAKRGFIYSDPRIKVPALTGNNARDLYKMRWTLYKRIRRLKYLKELG